MQWSEMPERESDLGESEPAQDQPAEIKSPIVARTDRSRDRGRADSQSGSNWGQ
jgi:hypothetical protein